MQSVRLSVYYTAIISAYYFLSVATDLCGLRIGDSSNKPVSSSWVFK